MSNNANNNQANLAKQRAITLATAEAIADSAAVALKKAERDFIVALEILKEAVKAHAHAETTLAYVRVDQQEGGVN